jgi:hypothetical protein
MMGGITRPVLATVLIGFGAYQLWRRRQNGWRFDAEDTTP